MGYPRNAALKRFARAIAFAVAATAITVGLDELPLLSEVIPGGEFAVPALTAILLGLDKWVRAKRAEQPAG